MNIKGKNRDLTNLYEKGNYNFVIDYYINVGLIK